MRALPAGGRAVGVLAALLVVYVVWGSTYLGIAVAIETMPPLFMAGVRFVVAGALLYAVARRLDRGSGRPDRRQWLAALVTGTLMLGAGNGGVSWAEQHVATGVAALIIATIPLWIALFDRLFFGASLPRLVVVGVAVGFAGTALLVDPAGPGSVDRVGALVLVGAAACWATGTLLSRGQRLTVAPLVGAGMQMLAGGAGLLVAAAVSGELARVHPAETSWRSAAALAYLVLFGSILAFSCYVWLLRNASTALVATYAYVNPVVAVLLGRLFLGEGIAGRTLVAGGVILAAVALIVSAQARPRRAPDPATRPAPAGTADRSYAGAGIRGR